MKTLTNSGGKQNGLTAPCVALAMICLLAFAAQTALAQNAKLDLSRLDKLASKATEVTNVNLEGPMLQLAAEQMAAKAKPGTENFSQQETRKLRVADMLRRLKGIYVKTFEFSKPGEYSKADVASVLEQFRSGGWKPIVNVEEKKSGESTHIYMMDEGGETVGMAVVAAEPKELTVVNIVGPIDFSALGGLGGGLGALGNLGGFAGASAAPKPQLQHRDQSDQQKPNNQGNSK